MPMSSLSLIHLSWTTNLTVAAADTVRRLKRLGASERVHNCEAANNQGDCAVVCTDSSVRIYPVLLPRGASAVTAWLIPGFIEIWSCERRKPET